ncbi:MULTISPECIES: hypothetical protein [unclassified Pseudomonas]|uniref:hypothetical protein n=1 Tax=unclassified Pseudomonas TaxID=196821 RepID=UPI0024483668|nr:MULTISPECIES: hypothetical protein [unclassified Pseudomonas]MDG9928304.1 hypothetical protein [Pseudomonas sp. GD04042]MDH0481132.1 hypothetical protein [Pseudomonas sp. GD04015]MDH0604468.1 hypothetical protein [Pseudomonas sp. GD03869]
MKSLFWHLLARLLARPRIAGWLIRRSKRTPYFHLDGYMMRWWLFNPYNLEHNTARHSWLPWSVRVHHILREDLERHPHDHPWNARTIILRGWYEERRLVGDEEVTHTRRPGDTATLAFGEYHHISRVSDGGVFTLFITGRKQGSWGFLVDGVKVPWRQYLVGAPENPESQCQAVARRQS